MNFPLTTEVTRAGKVFTCTLREGLDSQSAQRPIERALVFECPYCGSHLKNEGAGVTHTKNCKPEGVIHPVHPKKKLISAEDVRYVSLPPSKHTDRLLKVDGRKKRRESYPMTASEIPKKKRHAYTYRFKSKIISMVQGVGPR